MERQRNAEPEGVVVEYARYEEESDEDDVSPQRDVGLLQTKSGDKDAGLESDEEELEEGEDVP